MEYQRNNLYWGVILLIIGVLLLTSNFGLIHLDVGGWWRWWPLILIIFGFSIVFDSFHIRWIAIALLVVFVILLITGNTKISKTTTSESRWFSVGNVDSTTQNFNQPYDSSIAKAKFNLKTGAGSFAIKGQTDQLFEATTVSNIGSYGFNSDDSQKGFADITLNMPASGRSWVIGHNENTVSAKLNPNPIWDLDLNVGAATLDADLSSYKVDNLSVQSGAATQTVKLGCLIDKMQAALKTGASTTNILVPNACGVEIVAKTGLSSKDFNGFTQVDNQTFHSPNFDSVTKKIFITIEAGASAITVNRY